MILVTVGAGFIGSNFILDWLTQSSEPVANLDKLEGESEWKPVHTVETGIRKTVEWYLEHDARVRDVQSGGDLRWLDTNHANRDSRSESGL